MTARNLPRSEWAEKLAGKDISIMLEYPEPDAQIVVVEDEDGVVIGHWALLRCTHVEFVWIADAHRKSGSVARRLLQQMRAAARAWGARFVQTGSISAETDRLLEKLHATKLPGDHYVFPIGD